MPNKKKQASIDRKNRIRTKRQQQNAKINRERRAILLELDKFEEMEED